MTRPATVTAGSRSRPRSPSAARGSPASPPRCRPRPRPGRPTASSPPSSTPGRRARTIPMLVLLAAVTAWRRAGEPYPLSYALLRLAEARTAAGDLDGAAVRGPGVARAGPAPRCGPDHGRGRGARPSCPAQHPGGASRPPRRTRRRARDAGAGDRPPETASPGAADELARFGLTDREREVARPRCRRPLQPRRSPGPVHQREDRQRARLQHPRQARRERPGRGRRGSSPPGYHQLAGAPGEGGTAVGLASPWRRRRQ